MRRRALLTITWIAGFVASLVILWRYTACAGDGCVPQLLASQLVDTAQPLFILFGSYLTGILAFWFLKPFPAATAHAADGVRFGIAMSCTVIFIVVVLVILSQSFRDRAMLIGDAVSNAVTVATYMSFLVAPINVFYFGMKMRQ